MNNKTIQQKGAALMIFLLFFLFGSSALTFSLARTIYSDVLTYRLLSDSKQSYMTADAGAEDMAYRFIGGLLPDATEVIALGGATTTTTYLYDGVNDKYDIESTAVVSGVYRTDALALYTGTGASFNFGVQTGNGGFRMSNGSSVIGNVFSNGTIKKVGGGTATVYGDVISGGPIGHILDIVATGSARARIIEDSKISKDAYAYKLDGGIIGGDAYIFEKVGGAVVNGSEYAYEPEQGTSTLPITDEDIDLMKQDIVDNGTLIASTSAECADGEYFIDTDITLGFVKIECNLRIKKQTSATTLTLDGPMWVEGNIIFEAGPSVEIDASIGNRTVPVIADNPANRSTSSRISIEQGTTFTGSGSPKSYVLIMSQNTDAENGEVENVDAIFLGQSAGQSGSDYLAYAGHGRITLANSVTLKEITGYLISLGNSSQVVYESGLVNLLFTSGPGGGYTIDGWGEVY